MDVGKRLVLVGEKEAEFLKLAIETWKTVYAGDRSEAADSKRMRGFNLTRHLNGKYTKAEREEIAQAALDLMD